MANLNSLQNQAHHAAIVAMTKTVRSVLCEASSLALKEIVQAKRRAMGNSHETSCRNSNESSDGDSVVVSKNDSQNNSQESEIIRIEEIDVERAYDAAISVGQKWKEKLVNAQEMEVAQIVGIVIKNGCFLEHGYEDDIDPSSFLLHSYDDASCHSTSASASKNPEIDEGYDDSLSQTVNQTNAQSSEKQTIQTSIPARCNDNADYNEDTDSISFQEHDVLTDNNNKHEIDLVSQLGTVAPFGILSQLGCHDPCNLEHFGAGAVQLPSNSEWVPLPAEDISPKTNDNDDEDCYHNSSLAHHPRACILPPNQIQALPPNQLYGYPAPSLLKSTDSLSSPPHDDNFYPNDLSQEKREIFAKRQVQILDELCKTTTHITPSLSSSSSSLITSSKRKSEEGLLWNYGWDIIENAAKRNYNRLYLETIAGNKRKFREGNHIIVPRSMISAHLSPAENDDNDGSSSSSSNSDNDEESIVAQLQRGKDGKDDEDDTADNVDRNTSKTKQCNGQEEGEEAAPGILNSNDLEVVPAKSMISSRIHQVLSWKRTGKNDSSSITNNNDKTNESSDQNYRKTQQTQIQKQLKQHQPTKGRKASLMPSNVKISWEDVMNTLSQSDIEHLERTMIHPDTEEELTLESNYHKVQGALKNMGNIHMWEQVRAGDWDGPMDNEDEDDDDYDVSFNDDIGNNEDEEGHEEKEEIIRQIQKRRKRAHVRARKQRLGGHVEILKGNDRTYRMTNGSSKVLWAETAPEEQQGTVGSIGTTSVPNAKNVDDICDDSSGIGDVLEDEKREYWMELDLGEVNVALTVPPSSDGNITTIKRQKQMLAFRSLEITLRDDDTDDTK